MLFKQTDYKYVERNVSRHGSARYYFRAPGSGRVRMPDPSLDFNGFAAEHAALMQERYDALGIVIPPLRIKPGAINHPVADDRVSPRSFETMIWQARSRASRKGVPFDINLSWAHAAFIAQDGKCAVSGIEMTMPTKGIKQSPYQASIDRIKPSQGYVEENCRLVILAVNLAMNIWGEAAFKRLAHRIAAHTLLGKSGL